MISTCDKNASSLLPQINATVSYSNTMFPPHCTEITALVHKKKCVRRCGQNVLVLRHATSRHSVPVEARVNALELSLRGRQGERRADEPAERTNLSVMQADAVDCVCVCVCVCAYRAARNVRMRCHCGVARRSSRDNTRRRLKSGGWCEQ